MKVLASQNFEFHDHLIVWRAVPLCSSDNQVFVKTQHLRKVYFYISFHMIRRTDRYDTISPTGKYTRFLKNEIRFFSKPKILGSYYF